MDIIGSKVSTDMLARAVIWVGEAFGGAETLGGLIVCVTITRCERCVKVGETYLEEGPCEQEAAAAAFMQQQQQEDSAVAPHDQQLHDQQQHQEPRAQAVLGKKNGQEPSVIAFALNIPMDNDNALARGGAPQQLNASTASIPNGNGGIVPNCRNTMMRSPRKDGSARGVEPRADVYVTATLRHDDPRGAADQERTSKYCSMASRTCLETPMRTPVSTALRTKSTSRPLHNSEYDSNCV